MNWNTAGIFKYEWNQLLRNILHTCLAISSARVTLDSNVENTAVLYIFLPRSTSSSDTPTANFFLKNFR